jgi:hypothetical protein
MKFSIGIIVLLFCTSSLCAQHVNSGTFKAISKPVTVPFSIYLGVDSTKKIKEVSNSIFSKVSIPGEKAFSLADKNKDKAVTYKELTDALNKGLFYLSLDVSDIKYYLFYLDDNNDGYLNNESRISFVDSAISIVESIDHKKYAYDCDAAAYDQNMKIRKTGRCAKDGRLSISELRNACLEKKLWIGNSIYWKY